jgi:hypothetical protein
MADEIIPTSVAETDQQPPDPAFPSEREIEGMLATIPGLDKYFGTQEQSEEKKEPSPGQENVPQETPPSVAPEEPAPTEEPAPAEEAVPAAAEKEEEEKFPPNVQKRIDKITAQKHEALEKVELLTAKVKELEAKVAVPIAPPPTSENPLANVFDPRELVQRLEVARKVKTWALEHLDGGEIQTEKGETQYLDGSQVKRWLAMSEALVTEHIPQRADYLQRLSTFNAEAQRVYPNLFKAGTEENNILREWIQKLPAIMNYPDFQLIVADALVGQKIRFSRGKNSQNGEKVKSPTLAAPSPSSGSKVPREKSVLSKELLDRMATDRSALDVFSESLISKH